MEDKLDLILDEINHRFTGIENTMVTKQEFEKTTDDIDHRFTGLESTMVTKEAFKKTTDEINHRFTRIESTMVTKEAFENKFDDVNTQVAVLQDDVTHIKNSVKRIEENEPKNIMAMLHSLDKKLDSQHSESVALNKRLFKVESTIEQILNQ